MASKYPVTTTRMIVKVTKKHIKEGKRRNSCECPVALAISDALDRRATVVVNHEDILFSTYDVSYCQSSPRSVQRFVKTFDDLGAVKPFAFYLEVPLDS